MYLSLSLPDSLEIYDSRSLEASYEPMETLDAAEAKDATFI